MKRKIFLCSIALLCITAALHSQQITSTDSLFMLDKNWKGTGNVKKAAYIARERTVSDSCFRWDTYHFKGPLIRTEYYKDKDATIAHGRFIIYKKTGYMDSICEFSNGRADGEWAFFNDANRLYQKKIYANGRLQKTIDVIREDSIRKASLNKDSLKAASKNERESMFGGTVNAWREFLVQNFRYPQRALDMAIQGQVMVQFIVDETGIIDDLTIYKSVEYSLDEEALRIIRKSAIWEPATQNGKVVKSYKRQPIVYRLE